MASERLFNFSNIFEEYDLYKEVKEELKSKILEGYSERKKSAKIMVGGEVVKASLGKVLINLLIMKPLVGKGFKLTKDDLFNYESVTEKNLNDYFNKLLVRCKTNENITYDEVRHLVAETINEMSDISGKLNVLSGNSISFHDFIKLSAENSEAKEIFHYTKNEDLQFNEIEDKFNKLGSRIEEFFLDNKDTELYPFMVSGTGINKKQLTQAIGFVGLKPDIDGSIIPVAIDDNYLNGLTNLENYFINSKGTRKALIVNNKMVRRSGYLTRKLSLSMIDRYHDHNNADCETKYFVVYSIDNDKKLAQINNRHYYKIDDAGNKLSDKLNTISISDKTLIGKKIGLRSPVTCSGDKVCKTCYGSELSEINKNLNTGLISVLYLTNPLTQKLLSAKHLLTTKAQKIEWGEKFDELFAMDLNMIYFKDPETSVTFNINDIEENDDEIRYVKKIEIHQAGKKVTEYISPVELIIEPSMLSKREEDEDTVTLEGRDYQENEAVFTFIAKNDELTQSLQEVLDLIESSEHLGVTDYHTLVNKFNDLLINNGLAVHSVHAEMISSVLIRDQKTGKRLDFSKAKLKPYDIVRVSKSVMNAPLSVSMAFERIEDQLVDLKTYDKDDESLMDFLYR
jgi:hypothetical protein